MENKTKTSEIMNYVIEIIRDMESKGLSLDTMSQIFTVAAMSVEGQKSAIHSDSKRKMDLMKAMSKPAKSKMN